MEFRIFATLSAECLAFDAIIVTPCTRTQRAIIHEHACAEPAYLFRNFHSVHNVQFISGSDERLYNSGSKSGPSLKIGTKVPKGGTSPMVE